MFDFFKKLSFISRIQKAIKEVKEIIAKPETEQTVNKITGGVNKIKTGLNDIKKEVPSVASVVDEILEVLK